MTSGRWSAKRSPPSPRPCPHPADHPHVEEAVRLAQDGDPAAGYEVLLTGRARALDGEPNFETWADEMEARWDRAEAIYDADWQSIHAARRPRAPAESRRSGLPSLKDSTPAPGAPVIGPWLPARAAGSRSATVSTTNVGR